MSGLLDGDGCVGVGELESVVSECELAVPDSEYVPLNWDSIRADAVADVVVDGGVDSFVGLSVTDCGLFDVNGSTGSNESGGVIRSVSVVDDRGVVVCDVSGVCLSDRGVSRGDAIVSDPSSVGTLDGAVGGGSGVCLGDGFGGAFVTLVRSGVPDGGVYGADDIVVVSEVVVRAAIGVIDGIGTDGSIGIFEDGDVADRLVVDSDLLEVVDSKYRSIAPVSVEVGGVDDDRVGDIDGSSDVNSSSSVDDSSGVNDTGGDGVGDSRSSVDGSDGADRLGNIDGSSGIGDSSGSDVVTVSGTFSMLQRLSILLTMVMYRIRLGGDRVLRVLLSTPGVSFVVGVCVWMVWFVFGAGLSKVARGSPVGDIANPYGLEGEAARVYGDLETVSGIVVAVSLFVRGLVGRVFAPIEMLRSSGFHGGSVDVPMWEYVSSGFLSIDDGGRIHRGDSPSIGSGDTIGSTGTDGSISFGVSDRGPIVLGVFSGESDPRFSHTSRTIRASLPGGLLRFGEYRPFVGVLLRSVILYGMVSMIVSIVVGVLSLGGVGGQQMAVGEAYSSMQSVVSMFWSPIVGFDPIVFIAVGLLYAISMLTRGVLTPEWPFIRYSMPVTSASSSLRKGGMVSKVRSAGLSVSGVRYLFGSMYDWAQSLWKTVRGRWLVVGGMYGVVLICGVVIAAVGRVDKLYFDIPSLAAGFDQFVMFGVVFGVLLTVLLVFSILSAVLVILVVSAGIVTIEHNRLRMNVGGRTIRDPSWYYPNLVELFVRVYSVGVICLTVLVFVDPVMVVDTIRVPFIGEYMTAWDMFLLPAVTLFPLLFIGRGVVKMASDVELGI